MAEKAKVCCLFSDPIPGHAVDNRDLKLLASDERSREKYRVYRCNRCGAYVLYKYEETANYCGDWDNADIFESYYPVTVEMIEQDGDKPEYHWAIISGARWTNSHYLENDRSHTFYYQDR